MLSTAFLLDACGQNGSSYSSERKGYEDFASTQIRSLSEKLTPAFVQYLSSTEATAIDSKQFAQTVFPSIQGFQNEICNRVVELSKRAGSGSEKASRMQKVEDETTTSLRDAVAFALLKLVSERDLQERDALLAKLPVSVSAEGGSQLTGVEALRSLGLVDSNGVWSQPTPGSDTYARYRNWFDAAPFSGKVITITGGNVECDY